jgi:glycerol-3-phosphate acyltransferase PlsX
MVTICVDVMGSDEDPEVMLKGVENALAKDPEVAVLVVGEATVVEPFAESHDRASAVVSTEVIGMGEHPAEAVVEKTDSSIVVGCNAVKDGLADAFFSAGSTGAVLAASTLNIGRIRGVKRPALAAVFPGHDDRWTVVSDLGANADAKPQMIVQFAQMASFMSTIQVGVENPVVGLLSNGSEDTKGSELSKSYFAALKEAGDAGKINFGGNCEGNDLLMGDFDVIVCDGFTGNVALKTVEGTAKFIVGRIKAAAHASKKVGLGALLMKPALTGVADELSGDKYGGVVLLGLKAPVLIGHGKTSPEAVMNGIFAAKRTVEQRLVENIADSVRAR